MKLIKKSISSILLTFLFVGSVHSQTVKYKTISDDPLSIRKLEVDVNASMGLGIGLDERLEGYVTFGYDINASYFPFAEKLGFTFNFNRGTDLINSFKYGKTELGATYSLISKKKTKKAPLILSQSRNSGYYGTTVKTKSISVPQTFQKNLEAKVSIINHLGALAYLPVTIEHGQRWLQYKSNGIGIGLQWRKFNSYTAKINNIFTRSSSSMIKVYGDVLLVPVTNWSTPENTGRRTTPNSDELKEAAKKSGLPTTLGARIGFKYSENTNNTISWNGGTDIGFLAPNPTLMVYFYGGLSINLIK